MALAIYRKYRPKTLEDVLGQETVVKILKNAARMGRIAHAYLLTGPKGSGKTTTARLIAKLANCKTRQEDPKFREKGEPCNQCRACEEIDKGISLDVVEIDAASNRGIDEIRDIKAAISFSPTSQAHKVYIVDEAHQLTKDAFNSLLKTLEEPPSHAIIILSTTEYDKIPATIASRAQRLFFKRLPIQFIVKKLKEIAKQEDIEMDDEVASLVASISEGSFRDAEALLDQAASLDKKLTVDEIERLIGRVGTMKTAEFVDYLIKENLDKSLDFIHEINQGGFNVIQFCSDLVHYLRRVLALRFDPSLEKEFASELTDKELAEIVRQSGEIVPDRIISLLKSLIRAYTEMRYSPFASVPLEVAIIENLKKE